MHANRLYAAWEAQLKNLLFSHAIRCSARIRLHAEHGGIPDIMPFPMLFLDAFVSYMTKDSGVMSVHLDLHLLLKWHTIATLVRAGPGSSR